MSAVDWRAARVGIGLAVWPVSCDANELGLVSRTSVAVSAAVFVGTGAEASLHVGVPVARVLTGFAPLKRPSSGASRRLVIAALLGAARRWRGDD